MDSKPAAKKRGPRAGKVSFNAEEYSETDRIILERFRLIRSQAGLTQAEYANSLGITLPYVKAVEQGRFMPSHEVLAKLAKEYKRSMDWIYGFRD